MRAVEAPPSRNTRDARNLLEQVPPGSVVYMYREYDVEYNCQHAYERGVILIVCPKLYRGKPYRGALPPGSEELQREKYRRHKLAERPIRKQGCEGQRYTKSTGDQTWRGRALFSGT